MRPSRTVFVSPARPPVLQPAASLAASLAVVLAVASTPGPAVAQANWQQARPAQPAPIVSDHVMAFDSVRNRVVLFGGSMPGGGDSAETWEWNGVTWTRSTPATAPLSRRRSAAAFDMARGQLVMFGGSGGGGVLGDTWEWDGANWTQHSPLNFPSPRDDHAMAYDLVRRRVVLFGGTDGSGVVLNDTWEWDGANWSQMSPNTVPPGRRDHAMSFDIVRARVVMTGGFPDAGIFNPLADTVEWDGTDWTIVRALTNVGTRGGHAQVYDWFRQRTVVFSGWGPGNLGDTREWDGTVWVQRSTGSAPPGRSGHAMAFDTSRNTAVMAAGYTNQFESDTWEYATNAPATYASFGSGCPGSNGTPRLLRDPLTLPWVGDTLRLTVDRLPASGGVAMLTGFSNTMWGNFSLPLDLGLFGLTGCQLWVAADVYFPITNNGGSAQFVLPIPDLISLIGLRFFNQALNIDAGAPGGARFSDAGDGVVGAR